MHDSVNILVVIIPVSRFLPCLFLLVFKNNFLDYYVAYLRDLPECISLVHVVVLKEVCVHCPLVTCVTIWCCSSAQKLQHMHSELVLQAGEWLEQSHWHSSLGLKEPTQGSVPLLWSLLFLTDPLFHSIGNTDKVNSYSKQRSSDCSFAALRGFGFYRLRQYELNIKCMLSCICQFIRL